MLFELNDDQEAVWAGTIGYFLHRQEEIPVPQLSPCVPGDGSAPHATRRGEDRRGIVAFNSRRQIDIGFLKML
jgi:hypothetical protein